MLVLTKTKLIAIIVAAVLLVGGATTAIVLVTNSNQQQPQEPTLPALRLNPNSVELYTGNTASSAIEGLSEGERVVSWFSNNEQVATVDGNGVITAVGTGSTTVRATTDIDRIALVRVDVKDNSMLLIPLVTLNAQSITLNVGNEYVATATLTYDGQPVQGELRWTTTDVNVATVQDGIVTAVGEGSATIVCTATYDNQSATASLGVSVTPAGYSFCPDYQRREIWQGDSFELSISQTIDGVTSVVEGVTYTTNNSAVARINNGVLTARSGGDVNITASFEHNGVSYKEVTQLHVYGKYAVSVYKLGYATTNKDHTIRGKMYGDKITLELEEPVKGRDIKCWYVNGERIEGNTFIMPDEPVIAYAKLVNETEGNFIKYFSEGSLLSGKCTMQYVTETLTDKNNNANHDGNYVKLSNASTGGSSLTFNLEEGIVIGSEASIKINVYFANSSTELCFGVGNTLKRTYSPKSSSFKVDSGVWTELVIPTMAFGSSGTLLNNITIGVKGSYVLVDYIMPVY